MLRVDPIRINPTKMTDNDAKILFAYLDKHPDKPLLAQNRQYTVATNETTTTFKLSHNLVRRARKDGKVGMRYEVYLDNKEHILGQGSFRKAVAGIGNISLNKGICVYKPKSRVLKIRDYTMGESEKKREKRTYEIEKSIPHLHVKKPTFHHGFTFFGSSTTAMRRFKGKNLYQVLQDEELGEIKIDFEKRLNITLNILQALQKQSHDLNIIHRDIKPENIIIDIETDEVFIIDYEFSQHLDGDHAPEQSGTPIYMPIEQFSFSADNPQTQTAKIDVYAVGKTLADLWHATFPQETFFKAWQFAKINTDIDFSNSELFANKRQNNILKKLILNMTKAKADDRPDLQTAITMLEELTKKVAVKNTPSAALTK